MKTADLVVLVTEPTAAGGVGLAAVEVAKYLGARVIAAASSAEKLAIARRHGADELVNYAEDELRDAVRALTAGKGVDVVFDPTDPQTVYAVLWEAREGPWENGVFNGPGSGVYLARRFPVAFNRTETTVCLVAAGRGACSVSA